jgi:ABC-type dipeptide/oligopeptide/nickel transport system permease component
VLTLVGNLIADLAYVALDPRISLGGGPDRGRAR